MKPPNLGVLILALILGCAPAFGATMKSESFDADPGWEGRNNQLVGGKVKKITQDFGYTNSHFAATKPGEIGGTITRAFAPAFYAAKISPRTLNNKFSGSGTFALKGTHAGSGFFFGFFNSSQPGGSRPVGSLGLNVDGEKKGGRLAVRLITAHNQSCGTFITPFIPGTFRPTPIRNDGTRYHWTLAYDPGTNGAKGTFDFSITSDASRHEDFEGKVFHVEVSDEFKAQGTVFDRFGLMDMGRPGGSATVYFGDFTLDGKARDFSADPHWEALGNRRVYEPEESKGTHHYGFSHTAFAGGSPGEIGGTVWRTEDRFGWYADRVGPLTLDGKLEAEGRINLVVGAPDSSVAIGWFNSHTPEDASASKANFIGAIITGPTRVGHYFLPAYATAGGKRGTLKKGAVVVPGKPHHWKLVFDPAGNGGSGTLQATLDGETVSLALKPGCLAEGAQLDRFGIVSLPPGGGLVKVYFDDLKYTAAK